MNWHKDIRATREGLINGITATGLRIREDSVFVALPSSKALWETVVIKFNERKYVATVMDLGPWNEKDEMYVWGNARPQAESGFDMFGRKTNGAGIDLSDGLIRKMGFVPDMWENPQVDWKFITGEDINA